jgi:hypothetical protein
LQIQRLKDSALGTFHPKPLHKSWPEIIHRRKRSEVER